jgi:hypothetical protein
VITQADERQYAEQHHMMGADDIRFFQSDHAEQQQAGAN